MCTHDALLLELGHRDESIYLLCAYAFDYLSLRQAPLSCSSVHSLQPFNISIHAKFGKTSVAIEVLAAFILKADAHRDDGKRFVVASGGEGDCVF
jgi:hypothetical protein